MIVPEGCPLSVRQFEVLFGLFVGRSQREIAAVLGVGFSTVRSHLGAAYLVLGVRGGGEALARCLREGWLPPPVRSGWSGGGFVRVERPEARELWAPSPAQCLYLEGFDRLLRDRSARGAARVSVFFSALCVEREVRPPAQRGRSVDLMLERLARVLLAPQWDVAAA